MKFFPKYTRIIKINKLSIMKFIQCALLLSMLNNVAIVQAKQSTGSYIKSLVHEEVALAKATVTEAGIANGQLEEATQIKNLIRGKTASVKEFVETKVSDIEEELDLSSIPGKIKEGESYAKHGVKKVAIKEMKKVSSQIEESIKSSTKASGVAEKMYAKDAGVQQKIELKTSLRTL